MKVAEVLVTVHLLLCKLYFFFFIRNPSKINGHTKYIIIIIFLTLDTPITKRILSLLNIYKQKIISASTYISVQLQVQVYLLVYYNLITNILILYKIDAILLMHLEQKKDKKKKTKYIINSLDHLVPWVSSNDTFYYYTILCILIIFSVDHKITMVHLINTIYRLI